MKNSIALTDALIASMAIPLSNEHSQQTETDVETRIGTLKFTQDFANGYPTDATVEKAVLQRKRKVMDNR